MKIFKPCLYLLAAIVAGTLAGCATTTTKSVEVSSSVRTSLDRANLKEVTVTQDLDKGIVTLAGHVTSDAEKLQAETIAKSLAGVQVVANQIAVLPTGVEKDARAINSDLDNGIESNLSAALIREKLHSTVKYSVKNHVVTLTGEVISQEARALAEKVAAGVPNVEQVVNTLQVKGQKATSTN